MIAQAVLLTRVMKPKDICTACLINYQIMKWLRPYLKISVSTIMRHSVARQCQVFQVSLVWLCSSSRRSASGKLHIRPDKEIIRVLVRNMKFGAEASWQI